jgi:hypothetical protein
VFGVCARFVCVAPPICRLHMSLIVVIFCSYLRRWLYDRLLWDKTVPTLVEKSSKRSETTATISECAFAKWVSKFWVSTTHPSCLSCSTTPGRFRASPANASSAVWRWSWWASPQCRCSCPGPAFASRRDTTANNSIAPSRKLMRLPIFSRSDILRTTSRLLLLLLGSPSWCLSIHILYFYSLNVNEGHKLFVFCFYFLTIVEESSMWIS